MSVGESFAALDDSLSSSAKDMLAQQSTRHPPARHGVLPIGGLEGIGVKVLISCMGTSA